PLGVGGVLGDDDADQPVDEFVDRRAVSAVGHLLAESDDDVVAGHGGCLVAFHRLFSAPPEGDSRPEVGPRLMSGNGSRTEGLEPPVTDPYPSGTGTDGGLRRGVAATVAAATPRAPAARRARAAAARVAPVVATSSTTRTRRPATGRTARNAGPRRRSPADRPVWDGPPTRERQRRTGTPRLRATARARGSAGSKPRWRRRPARMARSGGPGRRRGPGRRSEHCGTSPGPAPPARRPRRRRRPPTGRPRPAARPPAAPGGP